MPSKSELITRIGELNDRILTLRERGRCGAGAGPDAGPGEAKAVSLGEEDAGMRMAPLPLVFHTLAAVLPQENTGARLQLADDAVTMHVESTGAMLSAEADGTAEGRLVVTERLNGAVMRVERGLSPISAVDLMKDLAA